MVGIRSCARFACVALAAVAMSFGGMLLAAAPASAHFVRPFVRQITGTPTGAGGAEVPFGSNNPSGETPGKIMVDGEDDLWVEEGGEKAALYEFGSSGVYLKTLALASGAFAVNSMSAIDTFYTSEGIFNDTGALVKKIKFGEGNGFEPRGFARDSSTSPLDASAGDFYVSGYRGSLSGSLSIRKFSGTGEAEGFEGCGGCSDVSGGEIVLPPSYGGGASEGGDGVIGGGAFAVDPTSGDIYMAVLKGVAGSRSGSGVLEFEPSGRLIHEINGEEAPSFGEEHSPAFSGIESLAVDPSNGDLLVSQSTGGRGVVDEFNSEGVYLGQITEAAGQPLRGAFGLAVDSKGDAYVVDHDLNTTGVIQTNTRAVDVYEAGHFVPGLRPAAATDRTGSSAVLNGFVDPESELNKAGGHAGISDCRFEYVTEAAFQENVAAHGGDREEGFASLGSGGQALCEAPDAAEIPRNDSFTAVHARVGEHIESGVTYRYRLSATVGGALGGVKHGEAVAFTAPHAPRVGATAASEITSTFADLSADVDPLGADTSYEFQYLSEAAFRANGESWAGPDAPVTAPAAAVDLGSGGEAGDLSEAVFQGVGGLEPATTYRFRVVASNEAGVTEGEAGEGGGEVAHVFTTQAAVAAGLPDGRAYELLTPQDKRGAQDMFGEPTGGGVSRDSGVSSESGDAFLLETLAAFGPDPASGGNLYVFSRHAAPGDPGRAEWGFSSLASAGLGLQNLGSGAAAVEPLNFSMVAVNDRVGSFSSEAGVARTSLLGSPGSSFTTLYASQGEHEPDGGASINFPQETTEVAGASRNLGVVVIRSNNPRLVEGARCEGVHNLAHGGVEHDACLPPIYNLYERVGGGLRPVAVQSDGEPIGSCGASLGGEDHLQNSGGADGAISADGSKVFFTAPIPSGDAKFEGFYTMKGCAPEVPAEVYMRSGEETIEVSAPEEGAPESSAKHEAFYVGAAEDGSRVFFTSEGELTANDAGIHDMELYEYDAETGTLTRVSSGESGNAAGAVIDNHETPLGSIAVSTDGSHVYFVAQGVIAGANAQGRTPEAGKNNLYVYDTQSGRTAFIAPAILAPTGFGGTVTEGGEATPDGRFLLFRSGAELTPGAGTGQLYRYDADTGGVLCVSCAPGGPAAAKIIQPSVLGASLQTLPAHSISDDGAYVFFNTPKALVPQATNGELDVYEWHEGHGISLIGSGQDPSNSYFLGASPDGANVFFGTHARLVPGDTDSLGDVYDARICTASEPCIAAAASREGLCEGDACSHPAAAPSDATPASATFSGADDQAPSPPATPRGKTCVKPKKLSDGKCVKAKPKPKRKRSKASGKTTAKRAKSDRGGRS
jgi:hypothetical protein